MGKNKFMKILQLLLLLIPCTLFADLIYFPKEYNEIYKEKYALELELQDLKRQYGNDLSGLESEKVSANNKLLALSEKLEQEKRNRQKDNEANADIIRDYDLRIQALDKKGSDKEKSLLSSYRNKEEKDQKEINALRKKMEEDEKNFIEKDILLKNKYDKKILELNDRIRNLENEISELKRMNKSQKKEMDRLSEQAKELEEKLSKEIESGQIRVKRFHNKLIINIDDRLSFDSGSAELKADILPAIDKIKSILSSYPENIISVEGHTDNVPISVKYKNNWQLSTERALSVLERLLTNINLIPKNFSATGYSEYQPLVPNTNNENRGLNRRVDIVVVPKSNSNEK